VEVDDAALEAAFVDEFEVDGDPLGRAAVPPPTTIGVRKRWHSSTSPALSACPARWAPPTVRSRSARVFI
jgi:hypothetical protein